MSSDKVLLTLLHEREMLSHRDNVIVGSAVGLVGVGALVVGALLLSLPELCSPGVVNDSCFDRSSQWLYLLIPLPSLALGAIVTFLAIISNTASQIMHKVEKAIWRHIDYAIPPDRLRGEQHIMPIPSSSTLWSLLLSPRRARSTRVYRLSMNLLIVIMAAVLILPVLAAMRSLDPHLKALAALIYVPLFLVFLATFIRVNLPHRRALKDAMAAAGDLDILPEPRLLPLKTTTQQDQSDNNPPRKRGSLCLIVPRPQELLLKSWVITLGMIVGRASVYGFSSIGLSELGTGFVALTAFEFCLYQARYMFNDIRDRNTDAGRAYADERGRCTKPSLGIRLLVIIVRIALWLSLTYILGGHTGHTLRVFGIAVLAAMLPYDNFADYAKTRQVVHPAAAPYWIARVRVLLGGPGYAIRALAGLAIGSGLPLPLLISLCIGGTFFAAESSNIAMGWVLEASAEIDMHGRARPSLLQRLHIAALGREAGILTPDMRIEDFPPEKASRGGQRVLIGNHRASGPRTWNIWGAISIAASVPGGLLVANRLGTLPMSQVLQGLVAGMIAGSLLLLPPKPRTPLVILGLDLMIFLAGAAAAGAAAYLSIQHGDAPGWSVVPPLSVTLLYAGTRLADYRSYVQLPKALVGAVSALPLYLAALFVGRDAASRLMPWIRRHDSSE